MRKGAWLPPATENLGDLDCQPVQVEAPRRLVSSVAGVALYADLTHRAPCLFSGATCTSRAHSEG